MKLTSDSIIKRPCKDQSEKRAAKTKCQKRKAKRLKYNLKKKITRRIKEFVQR